jgi:hypothetical protein
VEDGWQCNLDLIVEQGPPVLQDDYLLLKIKQQLEQLNVVVPILVAVLELWRRQLLIRRTAGATVFIDEAHLDQTACRTPGKAILICCHFNTRAAEPLPAPRLGNI